MERLECPQWGCFRPVVTNRELCKEARCYSDHVGSIRPITDICRFRMSILIREFKETDREVLRDLYMVSRNATFLWSPAESHQAFDFDVHTCGEKILVAIEGIEIVGFASIWVADSFLHNLFVYPTAQRRGIGRALLESCAKHFSNTPTLKCLKANVNATQFYKSQGWQILREELGPEGLYFLMCAGGAEFASPGEQ